MSAFTELLSSIFAINIMVVLLVIVFLIGYWYVTIPGGIPPGPLGLPLVGYLPFMGRDPHVILDRLAMKYGQIFSVYFGNQLVIVLNNYESVKEALIKQAEIFSGRPKNMTFNIQNPDKYNIATTDGVLWRDHRRFVLNVFRDCGVGKIRIEPLIMNEIQHFMDEIKKFSGQPKDFSELLALSVANNIFLLAFGKRYDYSDPWTVLIKKFMDQQISSSSPASPFMFLPWLKHIPGMVKLMKNEDMLLQLEKVKKDMYDIIAEQKRSHIQGLRDHYVSAFVEEQNTRQGKLDKDEDVFTDEALEQNMRTLLSAGTETTASTLMWTIIQMMMHPDIQKKVQNEIDEVIGRERTPSYNDRLRTPYTAATLCEVQRFCTLVPLNVPRRNKQATEVLGHHIPKNTFILSNLWAIHNDPKLWGDPQNFRPERFLSENGELIKTEYLIPFSLGKRQCPGEILARMELYLYFTAMLQKYTFCTPKDSVPSLESRIGFTYTPKHFLAMPVLRSVH